MGTPNRYALLSAALLAVPVFASTQESGSQAATVTAGDPPAAAVRDLMIAACAHDETEFERFLTARNLESFKRLAPAARTELMKRFVLLDGVGKASVSANPSGRPTVRCTTPGGAADIQIGGTELRENLSFLPIDIRDASNQGGDPHHIVISLVRERSSWRILSMGLLFMDLPSLEIEWDRAQIGDNERDALADLKAVATAVETYRRTYSHLPESLERLEHAAKPSAESAGLLDADLAGGRRNGYVFRMVIVGANDVGAPAQYELSATPAAYGRTGRLSFFRDVHGKFHAADHQGGVGHSLDPGVD